MVPTTKEEATAALQALIEERPRLAVDTRIHDDAAVQSVYRQLARQKKTALDRLKRFTDPIIGYSAERFAEAAQQVGLEFNNTGKFVSPETLDYRRRITGLIDIYLNRRSPEVVLRALQNTSEEDVDDQ